MFLCLVLGHQKVLRGDWAHSLTTHVQPPPQPYVIEQADERSAPESTAARLPPAAEPEPFYSLSAPAAALAATK